MAKHETALFPKNPLPMTREQWEFLSRRSKLFLVHGTHYSIEHLLMEAYLQGLRDAAEVMPAPEAAA